MEYERGIEEGLSQKEKVRQAEAREVVARIGDERLRADEDLEYFTIHLPGKVRHVPKRRIDEGPGVSKHIEGGLRDILAKEK